MEASLIANLTYASFLIFVICSVCFSWITVIGQFSKLYRRFTVFLLLGIGIMLGLHFLIKEFLQVPLLVPPTGTLYFNEFICIVQYITSFAAVLLFGIIAGRALLLVLDKHYGKLLISSVLFLFILLGLNYCMFREFAIPLIYLPDS
jgi:hypothetical protein